MRMGILDQLRRDRGDVCCDNDIDGRKCSVIGAVSENGSISHPSPTTISHEFGSEHGSQFLSKIRGKLCQKHLLLLTSPWEGLGCVQKPKFRSNNITLLCGCNQMSSW